MKHDTFTVQNTITVSLESSDPCVGVHIRNALRKLNAYRLTRQQFADAVAREMPWAFIHVGGRHVAIHSRKDEGCDALVSSVSSDWN